jgi:hypothetical protein
MPDEDDTVLATRAFFIRRVLTGHCGELLTPDRVEAIVAQIVAGMETGGCAWAFRA